jgi:hypothetical protein
MIQQKSLTLHTITKKWYSCYKYLKHTYSEQLHTIIINKHSYYDYKVRLHIRKW